MGSALNLYVLYSAIKMVEGFEPLRPDDYTISCSSHMRGCEGCEHSCQDALVAAASHGNLKLARMFWYYVWYATVVAALVIDTLRYFARSTVISDSILGFH